MTPRSVGQRLRDMVDHGRLAVEISERFSFDELCADPMIRAALERSIEIIGEAALHIPDSVQAMMPEIPWRDVIGMRNVLAHGYHKLDNRILWSTATMSIPAMLQSLDAYLSRPQES